MKPVSMMLGMGIQEIRKRMRLKKAKLIKLPFKWRVAINVYRSRL